MFAWFTALLSWRNPWRRDRNRRAQRAQAIRAPLRANDDAASACLYSAPSELFDMSSPVSESAPCDSPSFDSTSSSDSFSCGGGGETD